MTKIPGGSFGVGYYTLFLALFVSQLESSLGFSPSSTSNRIRSLSSSSISRLPQQQQQQQHHPYKKEQDMATTGSSMTSLYYHHNSYLGDIRDADFMEMMVGGERYEMVPMPDSMVDTTLFVGNLNEFVKDDDLSNLFSVVSHLQSLPSVVARKPNYNSLEYGFVTFPTVEQKEMAILRFHGSTFMGRTIKVEEIRDHPKMGRVKVPERMVAYVLGAIKKTSKGTVNTMRQISRLPEESTQKKRKQNSLKKKYKKKKKHHSSSSSSPVSSSSSSLDLNNKQPTPSKKKQDDAPQKMTTGSTGGSIRSTVASSNSVAAAPKNTASHNNNTEASNTTTANNNNTNKRNNPRKRRDENRKRRRQERIQLLMMF